jgi:hypothetical protein
MDTNTLLVIAGLIVVLLVVAVVVARGRRRRSVALREHFGPEYEAAVQRHGGAARAEAELAARQKRVQKLDIRPLPEVEQRRFVDAWRRVQAGFVDNPAGAVREANRLIKELMQAKGYPVGDFDQRAADLSVEHPRVVESYRLARQIAETNERGQASTDDLRGALVHYRVLFAEVLEDRAREEEQATTPVARELEPEPVGAGVAPAGRGPAGTPGAPLPGPGPRDPRPRR